MAALSHAQATIKRFDALETLSAGDVYAGQNPSHGSRCLNQCPLGLLIKPSLVHTASLMCMSVGWRVANDVCHR